MNEPDNIPTPRTDAMEQLNVMDGKVWVEPDFARQLERELEQARHENSELCKFINLEMKMTASDPRITKLAKRLAKLK